MREPGSEITEDLALIVRNAIKYIVSLEHDAAVLKKSCASLEKQNADLDWHLSRLVNAIEQGEAFTVLEALAAEAQPHRRRLTDEVIADLWHHNGTFHHHFARAIERWVRGEK